MNKRRMYGTLRTDEYQHTTRTKLPLDFENESLDPIFQPSEDTQPFGMSELEWSWGVICNVRSLIRRLPNGLQYGPASLFRRKYCSVNLYL